MSLLYTCTRGPTRGHCCSPAPEVLWYMALLYTCTCMFPCGTACVNEAMKVCAEEDAGELKLGPDFKGAKCLMNAEVALILQKKYEQLQKMADDPSTQVSQVFEKSLQYLKRLSRYQNPGAVQQVREILVRHKLIEFEVGVIANLCPETVDEVKALVPSIAKGGRLDDEQIHHMLRDLLTIKRFE